LLGAKLRNNLGQVEAWKVTAGLAISNGSLRAKCLTPGSAPVLTLGDEYGKPIHLYQTLKRTVLQLNHVILAIKREYRSREFELEREQKDRA